MMACGTCRKALGSLGGDTTQGQLFMNCLRRAIGLGPGKWDEAAHAALYSHLASMLDVQRDRGMTADQLRAVPYGAEPSVTAFYAAKYPERYLTAADGFWGCMGIVQADARKSIANESGPYYQATLSVGAAVSGSESYGEDGPAKNSSVSPLLIGGAVAAGVVLLVLLAGGKR